MDSSTALPGQPCQGSASLLSSSVTLDQGDQGLSTTRKMQQCIIQAGAETIFNIEGLLQRVKIANSSLMQQVHSIQTNMPNLEDVGEEGEGEGENPESSSENGVFLPFTFSNPEPHFDPDLEIFDLLLFDIPASETLVPLLKDYKKTMEFIRRLLPGVYKECPEGPQARDLSRRSRLIDGWVDMEQDSGNGWLSRLLTQAGMKGFKFWNRLFESKDPRTLDPVSPSSRNLMSLPVEILSKILDQEILSNMDRMRFGATCARGMSIALPVTYKYAMVRYPIVARPLNETLKIVGHMVRELVIHVPDKVDPVREEEKFIDPYEIFNSMNGLTALTIYFDAQVSPVEVAALLRYFLSTKDRLSHLTLDICELRHPMAAYESRTVYHATKAIDMLKAANAFRSGARLTELSICIKRSSMDSSVSTIQQVFTGHCGNLDSIRVIPYLRRGQIISLKPFGSRRLEHIQWVVREGMDTSIYTPALEAAMNPRTVAFGRIFTYADAEFVVNKMRGVNDPDPDLDTEFPFPNMLMLWFECVHQVPPEQSFVQRPDLRQAFLQHAEEIFRTAPKLMLIAGVERLGDSIFELRVFRNPNGSGKMITSGL
ncbi:hypothetical protein TWF730_005864 [Orbilia blumenaviensis]|uniref:F-box domain-containing protein n=1 Tax=Orbilia blumenaviensis TaxID=1796055 RepID=A0AAV9VJM6_9PEZI